MLRLKFAITTALAALGLTVLVLPADARMKSTKQDGVCLTEGGGRFVDIPGFPGEMVDRRLLRDINYLQRHYKIFVTDGYSMDPVHAINGEHPIGLGLDIVPDKSRGGTWANIDELVAWAEPKQNQPIAPFRWVGYDGDSGHGRGHHLHLSWSHSETKPDHPAESVYTIRCPRKRAKQNGGGDGDGQPNEPSGGTGAGKPPPSEPAGGVSPRQLAPAVVETAGIGA